MVASKLPQIGVQTRRVACDRLYQVLYHKKILDETLAKNLSSQNHGFIKSQLHLCLKHLGEIDSHLFQLIENPKPLHQSYALIILRLAATQLLFMTQQPYAVIDSAVEIAKQNDKTRHFASLINAVLRNLVRAQDAGESLKKSPVKINTPAWLWQQWLTDYGEQTAHKIATAHLTEAALDLSFGTTPPSLDGTLIGIKTLRLKTKTKVENLKGFTEGQFWVQDIAASLPAHLLGNIKNKSVLEYGAAPGGKSAQLIHLGARLTTLEISEARAQRWHQNMGRLKLSAKLITADGKHYQAPKPFDAILVDAPCSATGTARRNPEVLWRLQPKQLKYLHQEQTALLEAATNNLAQGGILVYAVCSMLKSEGLDIINHYLRNYPFMERHPVQASEIAYMTDLLTAQGDVLSLPFRAPNLLKQEAGSESFAEIDEAGMDSFYIARLKRT